MYGTPRFTTSSNTLLKRRCNSVTPMILFTRGPPRIDISMVILPYTSLHIALCRTVGGGPRPGAKGGSDQGHAARVSGAPGGRVSCPLPLPAHLLRAAADGEPAQGLPGRSRPDPNLRKIRPAQLGPRPGDGGVPGVGAPRIRDELRPHAAGL